MKILSTMFVAAAFAGGPMFAPAQPAEAPPPTEKPAAAETKPAVVEPAANSAVPSDNGAGGIRLNFANAPLENVLKYLSDAAGFHIVLEAAPRGSVSVISSHPMTKDEAVALLNSVLNKNGLAAIRNEQILTIVDKNEAKTRDIPVNIYNDDPRSIPKNDEIVTQIIPIRFVEARQLVSDLSPFVSQQATIVANEAGNSILITDTQANIRHLAEIIKAVDSSAEASTEVRVFPLKNANPTDVANLLEGIFPSQNGTASQTPVRFGGAGGNRGGGFGNRGGFGAGGGGGPGAFFAQMMAGGSSTAGSTQDRIRKQQQVVAVADLRTSSVVVTAQKDLMDQIEEMIKQLDVPSERDMKVTVVHLDHGDPQQVATVLQNAFPSSNSSRNSSSTSDTSALENRAKQNAQQMGSSSSGSSSSILGNSRSGGGGGGLGSSGRGGF